MDDSNKEEVKASSLWGDAWIRLKKNQMSVVSLFFLLAIAIFCFLIPLIGEIATPDDDAIRATDHWFKDPNYTNLNNTFGSPNGQNWLGTDQLGRDLFSRLLYGGQVSLLVGFISAFLSLIIGVSYGAIAGYGSARRDACMMRVVDVLYGLPFLVIVILFSLLISEHLEGLNTHLIEVKKWDKDTVKKITNIIPLFIAISSLGWLTMARMARAQVMSLKELEFVEAARSLGLGRSTILFKHIIPNMIGPIIVYTTLTVPGFVLTEASLSYLGLGLEAPNSSWGILLKEGANYMETHPSLLVIPAVVFSLTLFALNFLGDGLRDALDPKASKD